MKVKTISYAKVFPIAPYENQKIGVEIELDETDGFDETFEYAKELVHKWSGAGETTRGIIDYAQPFIANQPLQSIDPKKRDETEIAIEKAETIDELVKCKEDADKNGISNLYYDKFYQLFKTD